MHLSFVYSCRNSNFPTSHNLLSCCEDYSTLFEQCVNYLECLYDFVKLQPLICFETTLILDYAFVHSDTRTYVLCIRTYVVCVCVSIYGERERESELWCLKMTFDLHSKYLCYFNLFKYTSLLYGPQLYNYILNTKLNSQFYWYDFFCYTICLILINY